MLCVDWNPPRPPWDAGLSFGFDGGVLSAEQIAGIRVPAEELSGYEFVAPDDLGAVLKPVLARRVREALA